QKSIRSLMKEINIKGIAHITGGGFYENIPRIMPEELGVVIDRNSWEKPPIFPFLQSLGELSDDVMYDVFNMGIGMAVMVKKEVVEEALEILRENGETATEIGEVTESEGVRFKS